jgi:hypothetical protein
MSAMDRARVLILAGGLLVGAAAAGGTALAADVTCTVGVQCYGTSGADVLQGTKAKDYGYGKAAMTPSAVAVATMS